MNISDNETEIVKPGIFARLRGWFFTGLLVTAPVLLTVYITWAAIELIDGQVNKLIPAFSTWSLGDIPGAGLVVGGVMITLIGALAAGFLGALDYSAWQIFAKPHAGGPYDLWRHKADFGNCDFRPIRCVSRGSSC